MKETKGEDIIMFDFFISLGSFCPIADSMSKYGLRSFSAPFDWLISSDFHWVLHYMDMNFNDFLLKKNLERYDEYENHFRDKVSGFLFKHETENFEYEYEKLKDKYDRRIKRFSEKSEFRVCYLRSIHTEQDVEYIVQNAEYINYVVKKNNHDSEIVFLCDKDVIGNRKFPFQYYNVARAWKGDTRSYFDHVDDFLVFCAENYSSVELIKNRDFDLEKDPNELIARRYRTLTTLLTHNFSGDIKWDKIIIYGAGVIGKELYKKIKDITSVICFIDYSKAESEFEGVPIIQLENVKYEEGAAVIVSAAYDFEKIKRGLAGKFEEEIISLDDILNLKF